MEREVFKADWENGSRALLTFPSCSVMRRTWEWCWHEAPRALQQTQPLVPDFRSPSEAVSFIYLRNPVSVDPQVGANQCLGCAWQPGTVSCMALVRGRDEQGQRHIKLWQGPTNVSFKKNISSVRLSITFAHNGSANKMQVLTSSTSCSIRRVLSRDWKKPGENTEIWQVNAFQG